MQVTMSHQPRPPITINLPSRMVISCCYVIGVTYFELMSRCFLKLFPIFPQKARRNFLQYFDPQGHHV